jgi:2-keto-4-pentenoate hydratase
MAAPGNRLDPRVEAGMRRQLQDWRSKLESGATRVGWKIGLNPPAMLERLGLERPVAGHLTSATRLDSGATHSLAGGRNVVVEPEIAVEVGPDDTIAALAPALEVVDVDRPPDDVEDVVATNVFHRAVSIGPPAQGALQGGEATVTRNGEVEERLDPGQAAGNLTSAVATIASTLEACGERLEPGDWIITGVLAGPFPAAPGDTLALDLGPIGSVELSFTP